MPMKQPLIFVKPSLFLTMTGREKSPILRLLRVAARALRYSARGLPRGIYGRSKHQSRLFKLQPSRTLFAHGFEP